MYTVILSLSIPKKALWLFTGVTVHWEKEYHQTIQGLLDTGSELRVILGYSIVTVAHQSEQGLMENMWLMEF